MRQFYLSKNGCGYFRVTFVDPVTGWRSVAKSTHCKEYHQAMIIASNWLKDGVPVDRINSRNFDQSSKQAPTNNLKSLVDGLSSDDLKMLLTLISSKISSEIAGASSVPSVPGKPVEPVSENTAAPKRKRIVVIKKAGAKAASSEPVTLPAPEVTLEVVHPEGKHFLCDTIWNFWDYENSKFIQRSIAHGHSISKKHAFCMQAYVKNYWRPYFGEEACIEDLTLDELDDFFFHLHDEIGLASETVNKNINCANRCFKNMVKLRELAANPLDGIERFKSENAKRDIPTEEEIHDLLELDWGNETAKLAFTVSAFCGLRAGEISALRVCDIDVKTNMLHVRHSWSEMDKLKCTKNTDTRDIPIDEALTLQLMNHARKNPNFGDLSFVFWAPHNPSEPFYPGYYGDIFYQALDKIGVHEEERKERNIVFHSLRHFCATVLRQRTDIETVKAILGHRTTKMTEHYSDHETQEKYENMRVIMSDAWSKYMSA